MALNIEDKKAIVAAVSEVAKKAVSAVCADSNGIPVAQLTKLRKEARENDVYMHIVRNTLLARAIEGTEFECMKDTLKGTTMIGMALGHPGAAARIFKEFAKANPGFIIKNFVFEGKFYDGKDIDVLATLPTREEAIAKLLATMKEAAAGKLVRTLAAVGEKKGSEGAAQA